MPSRSEREDKDVRGAMSLRGNGGEGTEQGGDTWVPGAIAPRPALRRREDDPSVDGGVSPRVLQRPRAPRRPPRSRAAPPARAQRPPPLRFTAANSRGEPDEPVIIPYSSHRQHADLSSSFCRDGYRPCFTETTGDARAFFEDVIYIFNFASVLKAGSCRDNRATATTITW